jgi:hypothetical protein
MRFRRNRDAFNVARPDPPARAHMHFLRTAETICTNDGILDTPTIDTACGPVKRVCSDAQIIECLAHQ